MATNFIAGDSSTDALRTMNLVESAFLELSIHELLDTNGTFVQNTFPVRMKLNWKSTRKTILCQEQDGQATCKSQTVGRTISHCHRGFQPNKSSNNNDT
jgi:hypothetical protein